MLTSLEWLGIIVGSECAALLAVALIVDAVNAVHNWRDRKKWYKQSDGKVSQSQG